MAISNPILMSSTEHLVLPVAVLSLLWVQRPIQETDTGNVYHWDGADWILDSQVTAGATFSFADAETPADSGDHQHFTLFYAPNPAASLILVLSNATLFGAVQRQGAGLDYTLSAAAIALAAPQSGTFTLLAWYRH